MVLTLTAADIPAGSSFLEEDTGLIWRWNGLLWAVHVPEEEAVPYLQTLITELRGLRKDIVDALA